MYKNVLSVIGKSISVLHNQRQKHVSGIMAKYGLGSSGYGFLLSLQKKEGLTQRELSEGISVDYGLASRTLGSLEKKGYILRKRIKEDARSYEVYLTQKAKNIIPELHRAYDEWWEQLCSQISAQDIKILSSRLQEMAEKASGKNLFPTDKNEL
ncbi:MAG: MarR family transcriptional regulator [Treponema sp.]|jgi:DNA-binding MarR family transcriptional regulator|nr:MarR family transcriptional regulator [Treponema sp.]